MLDNDKCLVQDLCFDFKNILKERRILLYTQLIIDAYLVISFFVELFSCHYSFPLIVVLIVILKMIVTIFKGDKYSCIICSIINIFILLLSKYFKIIDYNTFFTIIGSFAVYLLRFKNYIAVEHISNLIGYPSFNYLILMDEKTNNNLELIVQEYKNASYNRLITYEISKNHVSLIAKLLKILALLLIIFSPVQMLNNTSALKYEHISESQTISEFSDGTGVQGSIKIIYCISSTGSDKHTNDIYWCNIGSECITCVVPEKYKEDFALLYNYYSNENDLLPYNGYLNISGNNSTPIAFNGVVHYISKYDDKIINQKALRQVSIDKPVTDVYIELVDNNSINKKIRNGIFLFLFGVFILCGIYVYTLHNTHKIKNNGYIY